MPEDSRIRIFAISDPHLSFAAPKPMDVFGGHWADHAERLRKNWLESVRPGDIVLMPGDISWAMRLPEARFDLEWLAALPGKKILLRGNHDYWWPSLSKLRSLRLPDMHFVHNNHVEIGGVAVGGSRLWDFPFAQWPAEQGSAAPGPAGAAREKREEDPEKIRAREIERLRLSLGGLPASASLRVAMTHFPPLGEDGEPTELTDVIRGYGVDICVFGHIHAPGLRSRPGADVTLGATRFLLASCDMLDFSPKLLATGV